MKINSYGGWVWEAETLTVNAKATKTGEISGFGQT